MQEVMGSRLWGSHNIGVRSVGSHARQGKEAEGWYTGLPVGLKKKKHTFEEKNHNFGKKYFFHYYSF